MRLLSLKSNDARTEAFPPEQIDHGLAVRIHCQNPPFVQIISPPVMSTLQLYSGVLPRTNLLQFPVGHLRLPHHGLCLLSV